MAQGPPGTAGPGKVAGAAPQAEPPPPATLDDHLRWGAYLRGLSSIRGVLVHDLRSRLNGLVLHVELLGELARRGEVDPEDIRARLVRYAAAMREEIGHLEEAAEAMLRLLQLDPAPGATPEPDLSEILRDVERTLGAYTRQQRLRLSVATPANRIEVGRDPNALRQAVFLLVLRALEAIPEGGLLDVQLEASGGEAVLTLTAPGRGAAVTLGAPPDSPRGPSAAEDIPLSAVRAVVEAGGGRLGLPERPGEPLQVRWPLGRRI